MHSGGCIDCDVHHRWADDGEVIAHLPERWRSFALRDGRGTLSIDPPAAAYWHTGNLNKRVDAVPPSGAPAGSDLETLREQLLDPMSVQAAVLTFDIGQTAGHRNPFFATALARAANDWSLDCWLDGRDDRLYGAILVATALPEDGAAEIRRLAGHPRMLEALLFPNPLGLPFGHPVFDPIHRAAADTGMPIALHLGPDGYGVQPANAGGTPGSRLEFHTLSTHSMLNHVTSFVTHGALERYPDLKVIVIESGVSWLPGLLWNLERYYPRLRLESPFVRRRPTDYFQEHVRLTTQPLEIPRDGRGNLVELLRAIDGVEEMLCFASDYPHWDSDAGRYIARHLPEGWHDKIFFENARSLFGLPKPATSATRAPRVRA